MPRISRRVWSAVVIASALAGAMAGAWAGGAERRHHAALAEPMMGAPTWSEGSLALTVTWLRVPAMRRSRVAS
jgi:hypothetical protein